MPIEIEGLKDLQAALRAAADASPREISKALRDGARKVTVKSRGYTPVGKTGALAADGRAFSTQNAAGVRYTLPYAGVQEFGNVYLRRNRGGGQGSLSVKAKQAGRAGKSAPSGYNLTTANKQHAAIPRFAWRAVNELAPKLVEETFVAITDVLKCHGWFDESSG